MKIELQYGRHKCIKVETEDINIAIETVCELLYIERLNKINPQRLNSYRATRTQFKEFLFQVPHEATR